jgi:hypothetical protein
MSGNDDRTLSRENILWALPPIDPLTLDDDTRLLADTLREAVEHVRTLTVRCDRQSARILALVGELRLTRAEAAAAHAQLRALRERAA